MDPEDESKPAEAAAGTEGAATPAKPDDAAGNPAEAAKTAEDGGEELTDEHGHPAISKGKYDRDIAAKDAKITELEGKITDSAKTEEGRASLAKDIAELKAEIAEERLADKLDRAGCRNVKAAKALIDEHGGDIAKLKEAEPWLFKDKKEGSTGFKPDGATTGGTAKTIRDALKQI